MSELLAPLRLRSGATTVTSASGGERFRERAQAFGAIAVVIADEDLHEMRVESWRVVHASAAGRARGAELYCKPPAFTPDAGVIP